MAFAPTVGVVGIRPVWVFYVLAVVYRTSTLMYLPTAKGAGTIGVNLTRSRSVSEGKSLARFRT